MQYEIEAGGRVRRVSVTRTGDGFAISIDGRLHQVDAARIDAHTLSLIVDRGVSARAQTGGPVYEATLAPEAGGRLVVVHRAMPITVRLNPRARGGLRDSGTPDAGPRRVTAPMPGKVVRVLVQAGDAVRARQPVVVVEAMKMENELRADRDGTVAEIHAREGMLVEAGALLIVIQ